MRHEVGDKVRADSGEHQGRFGRIVGRVKRFFGNIEMWPVEFRDGAFEYVEIWDEKRK